MAEKAAVENAVPAAEAWLALVDDGAYEQSWAEAASMFQAHLDSPEWAKMVDAVRTPLGLVQSRVLESATYASELPGAPDGHYVVIQYKTAFANKKQAMETVTPMLDKDGIWRVSGYYIR
ncbi:DUF4019 domain-containing protein [Oceanidesulfovibrio indonesiensis]|uniref:DUF4019 domain-containing protein n=1 Tax=Oceanidesulfovibrio indonesiensis TaxID=54767 RepID=UPI001F353A57|nr:DUF4019 domain-containing protein [Oceanidesulfovibrio indonesiensis]